MTSKERKIIRHIILAQIANDEAHAANDSSRYHYYLIKQQLCNKAIALLKTLHHSEISYLQRQAPDQNGYPSTIRYFEWREPALGGEKVQFSFHNPGERALFRGSPNICWDGRRGRCSALAEKLKEYYL